MVKFKEKRGIYYVFDVYENGVLISEAHQDGNSQKEAQSILENRPLPNPVNDLKNQMINESRRNASQLLSNTDYKVIRHRDQIDVEAETSLTDTEYKALLTERNNIRVNSNKFESEIEKLTTLEELKSYKIEY